MSANADLLGSSEDFRSPTGEPVPQEDDGCAPQRWCPEDFAREQIRSLVRRVFFTSVGRPVKQVVFSAAEPHLNVATICDEVALALARETRGHVALVAGRQRMAETAYARAVARRPALIKPWSTQIAANLWRVQKSGLECSEESGTGLRWVGCLEELGKEFEYVVIQGAPAGMSSEAVLLGQLTDGIILVLDARRTRRATARKIKETMDAAQCRMLGTVLMERAFPIPDGIYRRL
jgi:hypothetical protein